MEVAEIYHLYRRAGFGISPKDVAPLRPLSREEVVTKLLQASAAVSPLPLDLSEYHTFFANNPSPKYSNFKKVVRQNKDLQFDLNKAWFERICNPSEALNERMTLFWANVFVCKDNVVLYMYQFNELLRKHALGNFREFVSAVSKEPAMMRYLDTNHNKKDQPNENFARELLELFTLGVGNYSEADIKEAARAFTGYSFHLDGRFRLRKRQHDFGMKSFMGWNNTLHGDDIINIICKQRQCARYISEKLYRYFVNEKINETHVEALTDVFYKDYDIKAVLYYMFTADWFYEAVNMGNKIKSPLDLLSSMYRIVPFEFNGEKEAVYIQRITGQQLLQPPNVAGWEGGKSWIDTNTMLIRLKLPAILLGDGRVPMENNSWGIKRKPFGNRLQVMHDWERFEEVYGTMSSEEFVTAVLARPLTHGTRTLLQQQRSSRKDFCLQLMSLPEFQLT